MLQWLRTNPDTLWLIFLATSAASIVLSLQIGISYTPLIGVGGAGLTFLVAFSQAGNWRRALKPLPVQMWCNIEILWLTFSIVRLGWPTLDTWSTAGIQMAVLLLVGMALRRLVQETTPGPDRVDP